MLRLRKETRVIYVVQSGAFLHGTFRKPEDARVARRLHNASIVARVTR